MNELDALKTFTARKRYCDGHLSFIAGGSGRLVYKIDETRVLKLAKNQKGVAQCEVEAGLGQDSYLRGIVAPVYDYSEKGLWVEMALANKLTVSKFKSIVGYPFSEFISQLRYFAHTTLRPNRFLQLTPSVFEEKMAECEFYTGICDLMAAFDVPCGDLMRLNSYGVLTDDAGVESIVVVDYGLTQKVYTSHYCKSKK